MFTRHHTLINGRFNCGDDVHYVRHAITYYLAAFVESRNISYYTLAYTMYANMYGELAFFDRAMEWFGIKYSDVMSWKLSGSTQTISKEA